MDNRIFKSMPGTITAARLLENPACPRAKFRPGSPAQPDDAFFISLFAAFFLAGLVLMTLAVR